MGGHRPRLFVGKHADFLWERIAHELTVQRLLAELADHSLTAEYRTTWIFVCCEGLSFKGTIPATEQGQPDIVRLRAPRKPIGADRVPQIGGSDDAHELPLIKHGQTLDPPRLHRRHALSERRI